MHDGRSESSDDGAAVPAAETRAVCGGGCTDAVQHARVQPVCSVSLGVLGQGKRAQSESSVGWRAGQRGWHKLTRSHSRLLASKRPGTSAPRSRPYQAIPDHGLGTISPRPPLDLRVNFEQTPQPFARSKRAVIRQHLRWSSRGNARETLDALQFLPSSCTNPSPG
ncbi:hypothetical protein L1887_51516 [Cichorium endivia]|nr:hypothetical protein L1887_51516 [Cichorium endivia]